MSKTIKLEDSVYLELEELRGKRETFSEAVARILNVAKTIRDVSEILGPGHYLKSDVPPSKRDK